MSEDEKRKHLEVNAKEKATAELEKDQMRNKNFELENQIKMLDDENHTLLQAKHIISDKKDRLEQLVDSYEKSNADEM
jgi:hypothetical protein